MTEQRTFQNTPRQSKPPASPAFTKINESSVFFAVSAVIVLIISSNLRRKLTRMLGL